MDEKSVLIYAYSNAPFATNYDQTSQLGYTVFLVDIRNLCRSLHWTLYKSERSTTSVLGGQILAFADGFGMAFTIKRMLKAILKTRILLSMVIESKSAFYIFTKAACTTENKLMICF